MWKDILKHVVKTTLDPTNSPIVRTTFPNEPRINDLLSHRPKETLADRIIHKNIEPARGALIYCQLANVEHSGIYLGENRIAHLNGRGKIEIVSPKGFTDHITTIDTDIFIPVNLKTKEPLGDIFTAINAESQIGYTRNYNILFDNCHQFSAGCIIGEFDNPNNFLTWAKGEFEKKTNERTDWVRWKWRK